MKPKHTLSIYLPYILSSILLISLSFINLYYFHVRISSEASKFEAKEFVLFTIEKPGTYILWSEPKERKATKLNLNQNISLKKILQKPEDFGNRKLTVLDIRAILKAQLDRSKPVFVKTIKPSYPLSITEEYNGKQRYFQSQYHIESAGEYFLSFQNITNKDFAFGPSLLSKQLFQILISAILGIIGGILIPIAGFVKRMKIEFQRKQV